jgi:hypothetical protein
LYWELNTFFLAVLEFKLRALHLLNKALYHLNHTSRPLYWELNQDLTCARQALYHWVTPQLHSES